jgi:diguanylate cyclase (GGDEF)-like protein
MRRATSFAGAGAVLATGAPLGLIVLRALQAEDFSWDFVSTDVASQMSLYAYVTFSTAIAFAAFGAVTGAQADKIDALSRVDHLTGLLNRRAIESLTERELKRAERQGSTTAFLLIDVDGLKAINDSGGHRAGDTAIRAVADALRRVSRGTDSCGRWGGDEFALLACDTDVNACRSLAERIRREVEDAGAKATVSIGVSTLAPEELPATPEALVAAADGALYRAKAAGRNRVMGTATAVT